MTSNQTKRFIVLQARDLGRAGKKKQKSGRAEDNEKGSMSIKYAMKQAKINGIRSLSRLSYHKFWKVLSIKLLPFFKQGTVSSNCRTRDTYGKEGSLERSASEAVLFGVSTFSL